MKNFGKFMTIILALTIGPIINGFVFMKLWLWFIVPTFQMQPLRIVEAIGIVFFITFITLKKSKEVDKDKVFESLLESMIFTLSKSVVVLFFSWIITLFL